MKGTFELFIATFNERQVQDILSNSTNAEALNYMDFADATWLLTLRGESKDPFVYAADFIGAKEMTAYNLLLTLGSIQALTVYLAKCALVAKFEELHA